jgi:CheY-like chemotaxis protein
MTNGAVLKWLIAEDDAIIREIVELGCEMIGHPVLSFQNGQQVLDWMNNSLSQADIPDVALLDIRMPGGPDGHELSADIRRHPLLSNIAIILMTAYELPGSQRDEVMTVSDADLLLFKPLPPIEELAETAHDIVNKRRPAS